MTRLSEIRMIIPSRDNDWWQTAKMHLVDEDSMLEATYCYEKHLHTVLEEPYWEIIDYPFDLEKQRICKWCIFEFSKRHAISQPVLISYLLKRF